jgi:hypothetical protein
MASLSDDERAIQIDLLQRVVRTSIGKPHAFASGKAWSTDNVF